MNVQWLRPSDDLWRTYLGGMPHDAYHLPGYVALEAAREHGTGYAITIEASGDRKLLLPLIVRPIEDTGFVDATSPYGYPGPAVSAAALDDPAFLEAAVTALFSEARSAGIVSVFVRLHPIFGPPRHVLAQAGRVVYRGDVVLCDLLLRPDAVWEATRDNHKRDIKRALSSGLTVSVDPNLQMLDTFVSLYHKNMQRVGADEFYMFGIEYFRRFKQSVDEQAYLCVVGLGDEIVSAGLFAGCEGSISYHLSGTSAGALRHQPLKLMLHYARSYFKGRGDHLLNLGGGVGGAHDSLFHFKLGFSPVTASFYSWHLIPDAEIYETLCSKSNASDGQSSFFPAYRTPIRMSTA